MYAIIDLETSGRVFFKNEIIEIAAIVLDEDLNKIGEFCEYIKPECIAQWDKGAEEVHGLSWDRLQLAKPSNSVIMEFISFLTGLKNGTPFSLVCHALPIKSSIDVFDRNFLFAWFWANEKRVEYYNLIDETRIRSTIDRKHKMARSLYGIRDQKLSTWAEKLNIEFNHHSALDDASVCAEVFKYQLKMEINNDNKLKNKGAWI